jgi:hypothetical protein
MIINNYSELL